MEAFLYLEDGTVFAGRHFGAEREVVSRVICNTSMAGYTEILTEPAYEGHAVCLTYPLTGSVGVCLADMRSGAISADALIIRELQRTPSNFRADMTLENFMITHDVPGMEGIDTRALMRHLKRGGKIQRCLLTTRKLSAEEAREAMEHEAGGTPRRHPWMTREIAHFSPTGQDLAWRLSLPDIGANRTLFPMLTDAGATLTVYPGTTDAQALLADGADGYVLTDGPAQPEEEERLLCVYRALLDAKVPLLAIGYSHLLLARAAGAQVKELAAGHHGSSQPVRECATGRVFISSQHHDSAVVRDTLPEGVTCAFENVNDFSCEGLSFAGGKALSVQFDPSALTVPGTDESLWKRFYEMTKAAGE